MYDYEEIADALRHCMPKYDDEDLECDTCPFFEDCDPDHVISFPAPLAIAIRQYFDTGVLQ